MKDYSQNGEQAIILKYFAPFITGRTPPLGFRWLDVGANDGVVLSNTRALGELGFAGVAVEPSNTAYAKLVALYRDNPGVFCVNAAITTQDGPLDFYSSGTHLKQGDTGLLSTTHPEELARWKKSGEVFTKTTVRGITFETLMRETGVRHYDFISIDAEGCDFDILKQIDLTAVGCRLLCVEVNQRGDSEFTAYAKKHGMGLVWQSYENRIYARA